MKIKYFPYQPHCFAFGGFENLMNSTFNSLKSLNVNVEKLDVWSRDNNFDIAHIWGIGLINYENIIWAKRANKKVVLTALLPDYLTKSQILRFYVSGLFGKIKFFKEAMQYVDYLVVTNERHKQVAIQYFKFKENKVEVIPNTLLASYYESYSQEQLISLGCDDYVFTIGNICYRKNQLRLAQACKNLNLNLLIVGPVLDGEEDYGLELKKVVQDSDKIKWITSLKRDSMELISAYSRAICFALPSLDDQQPTCAQEAGLLGKPLLMGNLPYAHQRYYTNARLVNPYSIKDITSGLEDILKNPNKFIPNKKVFEECKEENVGKNYLRVYNDVLK